MQCVWNCQRTILNWFYNYGYFLAKHPYCFLIFPIIICGGLAIGFVKLDPKEGLEYLYAPSRSRAIDDREVVRRTFVDMSDYNYNPFSLNELIPEAQIIFRSKDIQAILTDEVMEELTHFYKTVTTMNVTTMGKTITFDDVCKKQSSGKCVTYGDFVFEKGFLDKVKAENVTYPTWAEQTGTDMTLIFAEVGLSLSDDMAEDMGDTLSAILVSAGSLKLTFPLKGTDEAMAWETAFADHIRETKFKGVEVAYSTSNSMSEELEKGTQGDIHFFVLTFTLMIAFASIVSSGGDCVSSRVLLSCTGVVGVLFGIIGAFGLVTLCGVNFVSIVGTMPFLTLGIGVDDMFLLMSSWSETLSITDLTIPERIGTVYRKAGIGITITSVTDFLAFAIGASSIFRSVRNFCIYTGVGVLLCYICNACVFGACLTFHARRVYSKRHIFTCRKVNKSRQDLRDEGANCCRIHLCGGDIPTTADADQSLCEQGPRKVLVKVILWRPMRYIILVAFAGYLAVAIWGCTKLKQGLELKNLAPKSSYFHIFQDWDDEDFGIKLPVSFVTTKTKDYTKPETLQEMKDLIQKAQEDPLIVPQISICWLTMLADTDLYNTTSQDAFYSGLQKFLRLNAYFENDIVFGPNNSITASRCHVYSYAVTESTSQGNLMTHMRQIADASPADVFAYHPAFVLFEQFVVILPDTLQTVGVTIAVIFLATCVFLPHPMMVILVTAQVFMIAVGIFGFMAHWDLTLSSITMIELIMSVGFSVDFCAHVCTAYMVSEEQTREDRAEDAIIHASGPILNGGVSSIIGVIMLLFTESYIFQSFFKIMLLVIGFGVLHAVFLVPVILSFIGPSAHVHLEPDVHSIKEKHKGSVVSTSSHIGNGAGKADKNGIKLERLGLGSDFPTEQTGKDEINDTKENRYDGLPSNVEAQTFEEGEKATLEESVKIQPDWKQEYDNEGFTDDSGLFIVKL
ncbi:unnamed protein product [Candidula unifasciata]|uniref:SSD domain-containing protein n=1 Tax=Candidula unifasciata TaxID=100452 RepID=A0A8S3YPA9_9EUPU|nr:unnamed protein product [Candidula unifasciata]